MKKILHITSQASYDGTYIYALRLCQNLKGFNHTLLSLYRGSASEEVSKLPINQKYIFNRIHRNNFDLLVKLFLFFLFLKKNKYEVIHYHSGGINILFLSVFLSKSKVIHHIHCHNINCKFKNKLSFIEKILYSITNSYTTKLAVSNVTINNYRTVFKKHYQLQLLENTVPFDFKPKLNRTKIIGYLGQITKNKNFHYLSLLKSIINNFEIKLIIKGDIKEDISSNYNFIKNFEIEPPGLDIGSFFSKIDVLLFFSNSPYEGLPLVILEALAYDVTVICLRTEITTEIFKDYDFFLEELSQKNIYEKIELYYKTPLINLTQKNKSIYMRYDNNKAMKYLTSLYEKL